MNSDLKIRTKDYALSVIRLFAELPKRTEAQVMGRQLLRSGTSVGVPFDVLRIIKTCQFSSDSVLERLNLELLNELRL